MGYSPRGHKESGTRPSDVPFPLLSFGTLAPGPGSNLGPCTERGLSRWTPGVLCRLSSWCLHTVRRRGRFSAQARGLLSVCICLFIS